MTAPGADALETLLADAGVVVEAPPQTVTAQPDGRLAVDAPVSGLLYPGSFNPIHDGHRALADAAAELAEVALTFELSVVNVDKPPLGVREVRRRLAAFRGARWPLVLTRAPTFVEKARLFPGVTFVIGWDTAVRLVHARYYGHNEVTMSAALKELRTLGCRFLVAGRLVEGAFRRLDEAGIPPAFRDLFTEIPESRFRVDRSSTELRLE